MPWSLVLPFALPVLWRFSATNGDRSGGDEAVDPGAAARFLLAWLIVPLLFFSLSAGKRGVYLLPIFPALALVCVLAGTRKTRWGELAGSAIRRFTVACLIVFSLELILFTLVLPRLDDRKSPRPIAKAATTRSEPGEEIGVFGMSPLEGGIAYYGDRPVVSLRDENQLRAFLQRGGRLVILRDRHLATLGPSLGLHGLQTFRDGRRRLALAERIESPRREIR